MPTFTAILPLDKTALAASNYIKDEEHTLPDTTKKLVVLKYGNFYKEGLEIKHNGNVLTEDQYELRTLYQEMSLQTGKDIFTDILITDPAITGKVTISYHALGGPLSVNNDQAIAWYNTFQQTGQVADWKDILGKPERYKPAYHKHSSDDLYGAEYIVDELKLIEKAILSNAQASSDTYVTNAKETLSKIKDEIEANISRITTERVRQEFKKDLSGIGLSNIRNLAPMTDEEATLLSQPDYEPSLTNTESMLTLRTAYVWTQAIKQAIVKHSTTNIGKLDPVYKTPSKESLLSAVAGECFLVHSKLKASEDSENYTEDFYPDSLAETEEFGIMKVSSSDTQYGGVWLGAGMDTASLYILHMPSDSCREKISWYKFLNAGELDELKKLINNHIQDTKNPHILTKKQIELGKVENLPVVTVDEIIEDKGVYKYMTLDTAMYFAHKYLLGIKPPPMKDGKPDPNYKPMDQTQVVYSTCRKCVNDPETHSKGMLVKTWCDGSDRFARYTDGKGGFEDKVLQLDSDDCKFKETPKEGTVLTTYCKDTSKVAMIADGKGGNFTVPIQVNSPDCGYIAPPPAGTKLAEFCNGLNEIIRYADGIGGTFEVVHAVESTRCGAAPKKPDDSGSPSSPGGSPRIRYSCTPITHMHGAMVTETVSLLGFTPNTTVTIQGGFITPYYNNGEYFANPNTSVQLAIDNSGSATWSRTYAYDSDVYKQMSVPKGMTQIQVTSWYKANGIESNRVTNTLLFPGNVDDTQPGGNTNPNTNPPGAYDKSVRFESSYSGNTMLYLKYDNGSAVIVKVDNLKAIRGNTTPGVANFYTWKDSGGNALPISWAPYATSVMPMTREQFYAISSIYHWYK